jgi:hypothetical protein
MFPSRRKNGCSVFMAVSAPNDKTERCGRPKASELRTDMARPHSLQCPR